MDDEITRADTPFSSDGEFDDSLVDGLVADAHAWSAAKQRKVEDDAKSPILSAQYIDGITLRKDTRSYIAEIPIPQGRVNIKYSEILRSRSSFSTVTTVQLHHTKEGSLPAFEQRLDLNSASAVSSLVTALNGAYGGKKDDYNWTLILNRSNNVLRKIFLEDKQPLSMEGAELKDTAFLLPPFLQMGTTNMVFGDGSTGKTYFALYMASCAALRHPFFDNETIPFRTLLIDYEDSSDIFHKRLHEIANGLGVDVGILTKAIHYYQPDSSMKDESEVIARFIEERGYMLVIIDAGADAAGGSPNDETKVLEMFNSLNNLPCTRLIIHHEPKNTMGVSEEKSYYGSTYWNNRSRITWRLKTQSSDGNEKVIKAALTKSNSMAPVAPFNYKMVWGGEAVGKPSIRFEIVDDFKETDESRIVNFLVEGESSEPSIAAATGIKRTTLQRVLIELMEKGVIDRRRDGGNGHKIMWSIPERQ